MSNSSYTIRNYRPSDFEDYVKLRIAAAKLQPSGHCSSPQGISEELRRPNYSPERELFVAETAGKIVGFIDITPELKTGRVILDCLVQPEHRGKGLGRQLLAGATRRAKDLKAKLVRVNVRQDNTAAKKVLPRLGFRVVRRFLELRLPLDEVHLPDSAPGTFTLRHLQPEETDKLTRIQNRCFAGVWGYNPNTTEEIAYYVNLSHSSPENIILISDADKPVGYCWTEITCAAEAAESEKKGRIYMLGADPDYRGRGIGKAVLSAGLAYLKSKGMCTAELTVDSENKAARVLYRSTGFKRWSSSLWYEKSLD